MCHWYVQLYFRRETAMVAGSLAVCWAISACTGKKGSASDVLLLLGSLYLTGWIHPAINTNSCQMSSLELCYGAGQGSNYLYFS